MREKLIVRVRVSDLYGDEEGGLCEQVSIFFCVQVRVCIWWQLHKVPGAEKIPSPLEEGKEGQCSREYRVCGDPGEPGRTWGRGGHWAARVMRRPSRGCGC